MSEWDFVDLVSKAKLLGVTEGVLQARVLSGIVPCFFYINNVSTVGEHKPQQFLPAWTETSYPFVCWEDEGSDAFCEIPDPHVDMDFKNKTLNDDSREAHKDFLFAIERARRPRYKLKGWVKLPHEHTLRVLQVGGVATEFVRVCVVDRDGAEIILAVNHQHRSQLPLIKPDSLFFLAQQPAPIARGQATRREQSLLRIIASLRELLSTEDGGNFPSHAKIIDQLVGRYGATSGLSKRNLEKVFAEATIASDHRNFD